MTPESIDRAHRLLEVLSRKKPRSGDLDRIAAGADSFEAFRIRLVLSGVLGEVGTDVMKCWRDHAGGRRTAPAANDLLHTLEHLSSRQKDLERQLQEQDAAIRAKFGDMDGITGQIAGLQKRSREVARLMVRYRAAIVQRGIRDADRP